MMDSLTALAHEWLPWGRMVLESTLYVVIPTLALVGVLLAIGLMMRLGIAGALKLALLAPVLVLAVFGLAGLGVPTAPPVRPAGAELRIGHLNLLLYNNGPLGAREVFLKQADADVMSVVEVIPTWVETLEGMTDVYPYRHIPPQPWRGHALSALLAKWPITKVQGWGRQASLYHINRPDAPFYVLQLHPRSPKTPAMLTERNEKLAAVKLELLPRPLVVIGDFNTVPWDKNLAQFPANQLTLAGGVFNLPLPLPTFPRVAPIAPIDLLWHSPQFRAPNLQRVRVVGTDHLGLVADFPQ